MITFCSFKASGWYLFVCFNLINQHATNMTITFYLILCCHIFCGYGNHYCNAYCLISQLPCHYFIERWVLFHLNSLFSKLNDI